jgi:uncharacterized protein (DUF427 family)
MTLTFGIGPLARPPHGAFNVDLSDAPAHLLYLHEIPKRVRGVLAGETVVDSRRVRTLHESNLLPMWYFPAEDVRADLLVPSDHHTHCPFKGDASYWSVRVGDRLVENAAWFYPEPRPEAPPLAGLIAFYFDRLDEWYEEDERLTASPRDPFHRVDSRATSRHVQVTVADEVVADSTRTVALFETGLPTRYYLPPADVNEALLAPSQTTSVCPYKGVASYVSVRGASGTVTDAGWVYQEPLGEALQVRGYLSFLGDGVQVTVDGEPYPG